jgi:hypothetical protein
VRFRDWNTEPKVDPSQFEFQAPEGAKKLERLEVNELGELAIEGVK